jgi:tetratricopeptide (TPR) repeat protein
MHNLAIVLQAQEKWERARLLCEEVLQRRRKVLGQDHPDTVASMSGMAWLLATCDDARQRDPARAVELATQATTLAPQQADIWNTLGVARYRAGDCKGAREALQRSMELRQGGSSAAWFFLAMAQWQLGEKEQARKRFHQAVLCMDKNQPQDAELRRFRAEAAALLGIQDAPPPPKKEPLPTKKWARAGPATRQQTAPQEAQARSRYVAFRYVLRSEAPRRVRVEVFGAEVTSTSADKTMFVARSGRTHRSEFASKRSARRSHRPK